MLHNTFQPQPHGAPEVHSYGGATHYVPPPMHTVDRPRLRFFQNVERHPVEAYRPEPGQTGVVVDTSYFRWWLVAPLYAATGPRIYVNGNEVPNASSWGSTFVPLAPGLYRIEVLTRRPHAALVILMKAWDFDMGPAEAVVPVEPGCRTPVYYRSPGFYLLPGAIAPKPPRTPGLNWIRFSWLAVSVMPALMLFALAMNILD
ncbi:hypothetical protein OHA40_06175 [Nocardia sp. NBC_00508]|uniref:hypothetical protein n=1 Tax=Nocardia sp. NBC_00508 TaxID=2975992 RepID=UPI002E8088EC|nr:hypothetical protein [Nocardia sp. NBC_00508]WUD67713.1 hypothetical protein OHA40_06175 [Nocardia sp. NBC_00508]